MVTLDMRPVRVDTAGETMIVCGGRIVVSKKAGIVRRHCLEPYDGPAPDAPGVRVLIERHGRSVRCGAVQAYARLYNLAPREEVQKCLS